MQPDELEAEYDLPPLPDRSLLSWHWTDETVQNYARAAIERYKAANAIARGRSEPQGEPDGWIAPHHLREFNGKKLVCCLASQERPSVTPEFVPFYLAPVAQPQGEPTVTSWARVKGTDEWRWPLPVPRATRVEAAAMLRELSARVKKLEDELRVRGERD